MLNKNHLVLSDYPTLIERFFKKVNKNGPIYKDIGNCWIWTASVDQNGYGTCFLGGKRFAKAQRAGWLIKHGFLDTKLFCCHKCDNPICVNPDHIFLGTQKDNLNDASKKGRTSNKNKYKTKCLKGHKFTEENTYITKGGSRVCRKCKTNHNKRIHKINMMNPLWRKKKSEQATKNSQKRRLRLKLMKKD